MGRFSEVEAELERRVQMLWDSRLRRRLLGCCCNWDDGKIASYLLAVVGAAHDGDGVVVGSEAEEPVGGDGEE